MTLTPILFADAFQIEEGCYTVVAHLGGGRALYHRGPVNYSYFTREQAERLARRVSRARAIDPAHWDDGSFTDMLVRDLEDEYYEEGA
jgi:hypothetical protein